MSDLISRSALIEELKECLDEENIQHTLEYFGVYDIIRNQPTVEAKPVVHGSWETEFTALLVVYRCSECNCATALGQTNFCPNCGADMRGEKHD